MSAGKSRYANSKSQERPISKYAKGVDKVQTDFSRRNDEIFFRIKVNTFVTLVLQSEQIQLEEALIIKAVEEQNNTVRQSSNGDTSELKMNPVDMMLQKNGIKTMERSTFQSVIVGVGESDFRTESQKEEAKTILAMQKPVDTTKPYLLLDVRPDDDYNVCHITTAVNYPLHMLSRAFNYEVKEMLAYKNLPGRMIIVYDENEKNSPKVASTLIQRGYDNVYLLTGGLKATYLKYPYGLITGNVPADVLQSSPEQRRGRPPQTGHHPLHRSSSTPSLAINQRSASRQRHNATKNQPASPPFTEDGKLKPNFTELDLEVLRYQLEYNLMPRIAKSRLTRPTESAKVKNDLQKLKTGPKKPGWR